MLIIGLLLIIESCIGLQQHRLFRHLPRNSPHQIKCGLTDTISETAMDTSFHKRPLPDRLIPFSSTAGKAVFREALDLGGMESYFPLSEQFVTQSDPAFCSLSCLSMVLNALNFDPKRIWKGVWRWISDETLQCEREICSFSKEKVRLEGMNFDEFDSFARCQGLQVEAFRLSPDVRSEADSSSMAKFRERVESVSSSDKSESFMAVNFSRKPLGQTGDGHFSPVGGYHKGKDLVLIMDVARFKYPPYWVPLDILWESMAVNDASTNLPRGYFIFST
jgi:glutathione gamma-glutamylcysteinyltransferase